MMRYLSCLCVVVAAWSPSSLGVELEWVNIRDPGNAADGTGIGVVDMEFRITKYEITNAQYAEFLNAVAFEDTHGLYGTDTNLGHYSGISRSGTPGSFEYEAESGRELKPVVFVSFFDAVRLSNWLHNGQPTGLQDATTTEDGAYTLTPEALFTGDVARNPTARHFVPSEDEWYKAAYYDPVARTYWEYPMGSDAEPTAESPPGGINSANFSYAFGGDLTPIGSYPAATSPFGTFDQGGNVWEWTETVAGTRRILRGGGYNDSTAPLAASTFFRIGRDPNAQQHYLGIRLAAPVPEPNYSTAFTFALVLSLSWTSPRRRGGRRTTRSA